MRNSCLLILTVLIFSSCSTLGKLGIKPSALETTLALREVLGSSTFKTIKTLKDLSDGNTDILPVPLEKILSGFGAIGYGEEVTKIKNQISNASEIALTESEAILTDAIKQIKFKDAASIVLGGESAATGVLKNAMYATVKNRYSASLGSYLNDKDAVKYWPVAINTYNLFASNKIDDSLPDFLAERAVDAVFIGIGKNEKAIRTDYKSLGSQVVDKVFDYYTK